MRHALAAAIVLALTPAPVRGGALREAAAPAAASGAHAAPAMIAPGAGLPGSAAPEAIRLDAPLEVDAKVSEAVPAAAPSEMSAAPATDERDSPRESLTPALGAAALGAPAGSVLPSIEAAQTAQQLDATFDGRAATAQDVLARLPDGAARVRVSLDILGAKSVDDAVGRLERSGLLRPGERPRYETDRVFLIRRLWDATSAFALGTALPPDRRWAIPAITIARPGITYYVHAVAHGRILPIGRADVLKLVAQIEKAGHALYSEQNLPAHYGFAAGRELTDHAADTGGAVGIVAPARGQTDAQARASHFIARAMLAAGFGGVGVWFATLPDPLSWGLIAALAFGGWLVVNGLTPLRRWSKLWSAWRIARLGGADQAEQWRREAAALHRARVDPVDALRLRLPPGPGAAIDENAARSEAIADAVRADTLASGAAAAHIVVGYEHAAAVAWRLADPQDLGKSPRPGREESQTA